MHGPAFPKGRAVFCFSAANYPVAAPRAQWRRAGFGRRLACLTDFGFCDTKNTTVRPRYSSTEDVLFRVAKGDKTLVFFGQVLEVAHRAADSCAWVRCGALPAGSGGISGSNGDAAMVGRQPSASRGARCAASKSLSTTCGGSSRVPLFAQLLVPAATAFCSAGWRRGLTFRANYPSVPS